MSAYSEKATQARLKVLEMIHKAGTSHIASNFSVIDIATVLYENLSENDVVVWSKGWASATLYYFLAQQGKIPQEDLDRFAKEEDEHIEYLGLAETNVPGVLCNGGAVGHGTPIAVGIAYAKKLKGESGNVYCIMSDGELNEGSVWESVMFATHHNLDNLVFIIDSNKWQAMGKTEDVLNIRVGAALHGFGFAVQDIDGHDYKEIERSLRSNAQQPFAIICNTVKGKGVSFLSDHLLYHYKHVNIEAYEAAVRELNGEVLPEDLVRKLRSGV